MDGSDKIKAFISIEISVYELFTGSRDLQYTPADLAKDPLPLHLIIYSSHLPLCFTHLHLYTHRVDLHITSLSSFYGLFVPSPITFVHLCFVSYLPFIHLEFLQISPLPPVFFHSLFYLPHFLFTYFHSSLVV